MLKFKSLNTEENSLLFRYPENLIGEDMRCPCQIIDNEVRTAQVKQFQSEHDAQEFFDSISEESVVIYPYTYSIKDKILFVRFSTNT
jgi:hypothetical protein